MIRQSTINRRRLLHGAALASVASISGRLGSGAPRADGEGGEAGGCVTDVGNIRVGHFTDTRRPTGCTVVLFPRGAVGGVDVRGSSPGTRDTELLQPTNTVERVNGFVLSGGSAFGLETASGVMRYLEENGQGYRMGSVVVPIVPTAILFDLNVGDGKIRPDANAGYIACLNASDSYVREGNVGAGAGATIGKFFGFRSAMKAGIGTASIRVGDTDLMVGAIVAVNGAGDVIGRNGRIIAGALTEDGAQFRDTTAQVIAGTLLKGHREHTRPGMNTTIGVVATNAVMTKTEMTKVAQMAHDGMARSISPVHTAADGDALFAAATGSGKTKADVTTIGVAAAEAVARAIRRAVFTATGVPGYPAHRDLPAGLRESA